jgi:hypothetical protein
MFFFIKLTVYDLESLLFFDLVAGSEFMVTHSWIVDGRQCNHKYVTKELSCNVMPSPGEL